MRSAPRRCRGPARHGTARLRHAGQVRHLAFDPDSVLLASAADDHMVRLWDAATGQEVQSFGSPSHIINGLAYSPDGKMLATGSFGTICLWEVRSGKKLRTLRVPGQTEKEPSHTHIWSVGFSPDGKLIAAACGDGFVRLWEPDTGKLHKAWQASKAWVTHVGFSPNSKLLVSCDQHAAIRVWDVSTAKEVRSFPGSERFSVQDTLAVFSPDSTKLATRGRARDSQVFDVATGKELESFYPNSPYPALPVAFSRNNKLVTTVNSYGVWQRSEGEKDWTYHQIFQKHRYGWIDCAAVSPDGTLIASGDADGRICIWDLAKQKPRGILPGHQESATSVTFSPDGKQVVSASKDGTLRQWDATTGKEQRTLHGSKSPIFAVAYSPDGQRLACAEWSSIRVLNAATGREVQSFHTADDWAGTIDFSPDGRLMVAHGGKALRHWDVATGKELKKFPLHASNVICGAQSPDGKLVAFPAGQWASSPRVRELDTGKERECFPDVSKSKYGRGSYNIRSMIFSPDSKLLAVGSDDGWVSVMDVATGKENWSVHGLPAVNRIAFSPDGKLLACGSSDVHVWEAPTGKAVATFRGHLPYAQVRSIAFSLDSKRLASASDDTTVILWAVGP